MKNTDRTLQLVNGGVSLYFGVEKAPCFRWLQNESFKEPCAARAQISNMGALSGKLLQECFKVKPTGKPPLFGVP